MASQARAVASALAAVSRAADQAAHLRLLAEARGAAAWVEASLIDQAARISRILCGGDAIA